MICCNLFFFSSSRKKIPSLISRDILAMLFCLITLLRCFISLLSRGIDLIINLATVGGGEKDWCFRFLYYKTDGGSRPTVVQTYYKTDGGSNWPILVPISRQHYLPDPVNQGNHVVYPPLFAKPHSSAGSPLALSGTPSASYHAA